MNAMVQQIHELPPPGRSLTAAHVREHVNLIQEVMHAVMKKDTHYGVIPGCKQPSLYKAGSEVLLATFRIAVKPVVTDLSTEDCIRYRVTTIGTHQVSGVVVGEGIGECSSNEEKYKWRKCWTKEEFDASPETRRRIKFTRSGKEMQIRTEPADLANTVLKMAKKRAQIDMTLTATAASDIFTQDIEDLPDELREEVAPTPAHTLPEHASTKALVDACKTADEFATLWKQLTPPIRKVFAEYVKERKEAALAAAPVQAEALAPEGQAPQEGAAAAEETPA
jgi:hypothetical protein